MDELKPCPFARTQHRASIVKLGERQPRMMTIA